MSDTNDLVKRLRTPVGFQDLPFIQEEAADEIIRLKAELEAAKKQARVEALREAAKICAEYEETFERREANGAAHGAGTCFKAIQALIEGEE